MAVIDIQTFLLALGIGNLGLAVLMAGYTHNAGPSLGLRLWVWARCGMGFSQLLGWARPLLGDAPPAGLESVGWLLSASLEMAAVCVFFGFARWGRVLLPITLLSGGAVIGAGIRGAGQPDLDALVAGVVALFAAAMAWILLRRRSASPLQRIIGAGDALFALAMGSWAALGLVGAPMAGHGLA